MPADVVKPVVLVRRIRRLCLRPFAPMATRSNSLQALCAAAARHRQVLTNNLLHLDFRLCCEVVAVAVQQNGLALQYAEPCLRRDLELLKLAARRLTHCWLSVQTCPQTCCRIGGGHTTGATSSQPGTVHFRIPRTKCVPSQPRLARCGMTVNWLLQQSVWIGGLSKAGSRSTWRVNSMTTVLLIACAASRCWTGDAE